MYDVPNASTALEAGSGQRVVGRTLPFGWKPDAYGEQQIGPEQFIWWGQDRVIYAKNVRDEPRGRFEYGKGTTELLWLGPILIVALSHKMFILASTPSSLEI